MARAMEVKARASLHALVSAAATAKQVSINSWIVEAVRRMPPVALSGRGRE